MFRSSADLQEYYFLLIFVYSEVKGKELLISPEAKSCTKTVTVESMLLSMEETPEIPNC